MTQVIIKSANQSDNVRYLIRAALDSELRVLKLGIEKTNRNLERLEKRFNINSQEFYQRFQKGEIDDKIDYIKWAGEYETLLQLQQDYNELREIMLC